jgi:hypothetical protein
MLSRHWPASGLTGEANVAKRISEAYLHDVRIIPKDVSQTQSTGLIDLGDRHTLCQRRQTLVIGKTGPHAIGFIERENTWTWRRFQRDGVAQRIEGSLLDPIAADLRLKKS